MGWLLLVAMLHTGADTVTVSAAEALARAVENSPAVEAAALQARSASYGAQQAEAWANPLLSVSVENLGSSEAFTGVPGVKGLEGQAVLSTPVGLGGDRGSRIRHAQALERQVSAGATVVRADHAQAVAEVIAAALRDRALVETAREELETLDRLAAALALQEQEGRASRGDAARADLARGQAATRLARRRVAEAGSSEALARILGLDPGTPVDVTLSVCVAPDRGEAPGEAGARAEGAASASPAANPDLVEAEARIEVAQAAIDQALAQRIPDLLPQVGLRRTGGNSGLYIGLNAALPFFDYGNRGVDAARATEAAADRSREDLLRRIAAERSAAERARAALAEAGQAFSPRWRANLEAAVTAAEARFELGEGTLYELLDNRRARLTALEDYWQWQAEWWIARARQARLEGAGLSAFAPCAFPETEGEG